MSGGSSWFTATTTSNNESQQHQNTQSHSHRRFSIYCFRTAPAICQNKVAGFVRPSEFADHVIVGHGGKVHEC
ncbi:MAG: hypothetical protein ACK56I_13620, partial [bacterium]